LKSRNLPVIPSTQRAKQVNLEYEAPLPPNKEFSVGLTETEKVKTQTGRLNIARLRHNG
jgi:hypothetical protein